MPVNRFGQELPKYDSSASIGGDPVLTTDLTGDQSALNASGVPDGYVPTALGNGGWAWEPAAAGGGGGNVTDPGALRAANNLSDLGSASTARTNLGLGTAATQNTDAFEPAGAVAAAIAGLGALVDWKASVRAATTANITLSGTQTIDGVALAVGDRVLVKNQSAATANGIYVVAAGTWTRALDADAFAEVTPGMCVPVEEGSTNGAKLFILATPAPITLGSTNLTFQEVSGTGGGGGLTTEQAQDIVGAMLQPGNASVALVYDDPNGVLTIEVIPEWVQDTVAAMFTGNAGVTYNDNGGANGTITLPSSGTSNLETAFPVTVFIPLTSPTAAPPSASTSVAIPGGYWRAPWPFTLTEVRAYCQTPSAATETIVDVHLGASGSDVTILGTNKLRIDATERSSTTAALGSSIATSSIPNDGELWVYADQIGSDVRGLTLVLLGTRNVSASAPTAPGAPTGVSGTPGDGTVSLSWAAPASNGGSAITDYLIEFSSNGGTSWTAFTDSVSTATTATVTGLTNGTGYIFRVRAVNAAGNGAFSSASSSVTPSAGGGGLPAPTGVNVETGALLDGSGILLWTASSPATGVSGYNIEVRNEASAGNPWRTLLANNSGGASATNKFAAIDLATLTPADIPTGVTVGIRIRARNSAGTTTSSWVTLTGIPNNFGG